jgi:plastocyanin
MKLFNKFFLLFVILFFSLLSCSKHDDSDIGAHEIHLEYKAFHPFQLTVPVGTAVLFNNVGGGGTHTVSGNLFNSGKIQVDDDFTYTFTTVGTYFFYCAMHSDNAQERVTVIVE